MMRDSLSRVGAPPACLPENCAVVDGKKSRAINPFSRTIPAHQTIALAAPLALAVLACVTLLAAAGVPAVALAAPDVSVDADGRHIRLLMVATRSNGGVSADEMNSCLWRV